MQSMTSTNQTRILSLRSVEDLSHQKLILILPNGLSKHEKRLQDKN